MDPEDLLIDVSQFNDGSVLLLLILANNYEFFILGQPALQNYYMTFDMYKLNMKVIPNSQTSKPYLIAGVVPKDLIGKGTTPTWLKWLSLLFLVVMITLWYTLI
jgi:hypothetical protein